MSLAKVLNDKPKYSILLYEKDGVPRYFEIPKATLRALFVILPLIGLGLTTTTYLSLRKYYRAKSSSFGPNPALLQQINSEKKQLLDEVADLKDLNKELQDKLSSIEGMTSGEATTPIETTGPDVAPTATGANSATSLFDIFTPIQGFKDLTSNRVFATEDPEVITIKDKIHFRFNIVNQSKDNLKYSGHVFVILKDSGAFHIYPPDAMMTQGFKINFNQGEPFATTRFRPVEATFRGHPIGENGVFNVLIFSRTGDLVHRQSFIKKLRP